MISRIDRPSAVVRRPSYWLWTLAFLFTGLSLLQLALVDHNLSLTTFVPLFILMACGGMVIYWLDIRLPHLAGDPILLPLTFFLSGLGLVMIQRLAPVFVSRQLFWLVIATVLLLLINLIPKNLNWLGRYKYTWLIGGILLLASTLIFGVNPSGFGARLWLNIGPVYFQPSELLKLLLLVFLAAYLADRRRQLVEVRAYIGGLAVPHPNYLGPMLLMWGFSMVLLIWQRDLGAALLFFGTFLGMLYAATGQSSYIWGGLLLLLLGGIVGYELFDVVRIRVDGFLNPWLDASGRSFQIVQSLLAFASGGVIGQGLGQGLPAAIPVVHTDFVYAAIGEEFGLVGALGILICFALLVNRAFAIAFRARTDFEQLLAVGIGTMLALQTLVITAGTLKLMPLTGVTLPFVSYGGSSLIVSFIMVGLLSFMAAPQPHHPRPVSALLRSTFQTPTYYLKLARILFFGLIVVAGGLILWQIAAPPFLVTRDDNPRQVIAEQRIDRGRLLTRGGIPIAETLIGADGLAQRHYPYPGLSSVTGYYSIRYGVGGVEATFDPILRGRVDETTESKVVDDLLHRPPVGRDVTLTVDLPAQVAADVALGDQEGAVVILEIETGAVLVMSSHPTYDPNTLDEMWDSLRQDERAPLLNRATQGLFPVGDLARLIGLIGLYDSGATRPTDLLAAPLEEMLAPLGPTGYAATVRQLGLMQSLSGLRSQPGRLPDFNDKGTVKDLAVTPLHLARVMTALERDGQLPTPMLALDAAPEQTPSFKPSTAQIVRAWLPQVDEQLIGLSGQASPEETGQQSLSWFVGLAPATASGPPVEPTSPALTESGLIFDPSQIEAVTPTPTIETPQEKAKYAVVAVVVTNTPADNPALHIARAALKPLLEPSTK
ncbi:MAG: FtsW/RodA/SpoVE family cell cycle protein [Anaerolineae bacterium]|nr:FtsW/RodA/SpoVE family cell cycle protein [Anaerolineae bacterium]